MKWISFFAGREVSFLPAVIEFLVEKEFLMT